MNATESTKNFLFGAGISKILPLHLRSNRQLPQTQKNGRR